MSELRNIYRVENCTSYVCIVQFLITINKLYLNKYNKY